MECKAEPTKEHAWLAKMAGEWEFEVEGMCEPGEPPHKSSGRERVRTLGDLWVIGEGEGGMPDGGEARMLLTLGYDPAKQKFVGSWVGSMMTHMFVYEGELEADGKTLTLETEGPSFTAPGKMSKYRDVYEMVSEDERILRSMAPDGKGGWTVFNTARYRRVG